MSSTKLNVGICGEGHLALRHIEALQLNSKVNMVGYVTSNLDDYATFSKLGLASFDTFAELVNVSDVIDIVSGVERHLDIVSLCAKSGKHIFVETPMANSVYQAKEMVALINESGIQCQVGHHLRFNPIYTYAQQMCDNPLLLVCSLKVPLIIGTSSPKIVYDLMIEHIDVVMNIVQSPVKQVIAHGFLIFSDNDLDIVNTQLLFFNGCKADITVSHMTTNHVNLINIYQHSRTMELNFIDDKISIRSALDQVTVKQGSVLDNFTKNKDDLYLALDSFVDSILNKTPLIVDEYSGLKNLEIAEQIVKQIVEE